MEQSTTHRYGCPECGSERISYYTGVVVRYHVHGWTEDGKPDLLDKNETIWDLEEPLKDNPYTCRDCEEEFSFPVRVDAEPHTVSPEVSGDYRCPFCANASDFLGHDDRGYPGSDCECGAYDEGGECKCRVTLSQYFWVARGDDGEVNVTYRPFTGGGQDAEIGPYTRIECPHCGRTIYTEQEEERE